MFVLIGCACVFLVVGLQKPSASSRAGAPDYGPVVLPTKRKGQMVEVGCPAADLPSSLSTLPKEPGDTAIAVRAAPENERPPEQQQKTGSRT